MKYNNILKCDLKTLAFILLGIFTSYVILNRFIVKKEPMLDELKNKGLYIVPKISSSISGPYSDMVSKTMSDIEEQTRQSRANDKATIDSTPNVQ